MTLSELRNELEWLAPPSSPEVTQDGEATTVRFSSKPPAEIRSWLKSQGFRWRRGAWRLEPPPEPFAVPDASLSTSCYANIEKIPKRLKPVGISVGIPPACHCRRYRSLFPTREMLKMPIADYNRLYDEILDGLDPHKVFDDIGKGAVLLCWEKPNILCHRRRVAEWLEESLDIVVPELGFDRSETPEYARLPAAK